MPAEKATRAEPEKSSEGAEREAPRPPGVSMNHDKDADSGEAPDAIDRLLGRRRRVRSLPGPRAESFPPALGPPSPTVEPPTERAPAAEVSLSPKHVYVTVEIASAAKDAMDVHATDRTLTIHAPRVQGAAYHLEVELPSVVDPRSAQVTFRNGILDVTLARAKRPRGEHHDR